MITALGNRLFRFFKLSFLSPEQILICFKIAFVKLFVEFIILLSKSRKRTVMTGLPSKIFIFVLSSSDFKLSQFIQLTSVLFPQPASPSMNKNGLLPVKKLASLSSRSVLGLEFSYTLYLGITNRLQRFTLLSFCSLCKNKVSLKLSAQALLSVRTAFAGFPYSGRYLLSKSSYSSNIVSISSQNHTSILISFFGLCSMIISSMFVSLSIAAATIKWLNCQSFSL